MKKIIATMVSIIAVAAMLTACGSDSKDNSETTVSTTAATDSANVADASNTGSAGAGYSVYTYLSSSKAATAEANGGVEVNSYIAYTAIGEDGKIFKAGINAVQSKVPFDAKGQIVEGTDLSVSVKSKNELGDDYGMRKASGIGKEWNEQAQALADWSIGKTISDISDTKLSDNGKYEDADLVSSVTVSAGNFQKILTNSSEHQLKGTVGANDKMGMGIETKISSSKSATADAVGVGQVDSLLAVVAVDGDGKITACGFDAIQSKVQFNADGTIATDLTAAVKTKAELKGDYGMAKASPIGKEWFEQAESFAEWCVGKTVSEVTGMQTKKVDDNHPQVPDVADLNSTVTISVGDFLSALEKAAANVK